MFTLREYQQNALDILQQYFRTSVRLTGAVRHPADVAFQETTEAVFGRKLYYNPVPGLQDMPYVCIRIPTGGGKTFVACHAIGITVKDLLQVDHGLVLWLVPSTAILEQTLNALKELSHPYRRALEDVVGNVTVIDIRKALAVTPATLKNSTTVIVSTIQAFRVQDTEGRKVYEESGALMGHFENLPELLKSQLEAYDNGQPKRSLANVLALHRPVLIVDEAHNSRTELSFDTLNRFRPSCIIELTATPDTQKNSSNVIYSVSAAELKAEEMIKLPILLEVNPNWRELLSASIARLNELKKQSDEEAKLTGERIRPVMLIQAQPRRGPDPITVDVVRDCLMTDFEIPAEQIVRATSEYKELPDDISSADNPVRFVITVQALREGWDCPMAYVLSSIAEMRSGTAVEQILGRIMRLPNVKRKQEADLNQAYAYVASRHFGATARALVEGLVQNGFDRTEAEEFVVPPKQQDLGLTDLPLFREKETSYTIDAPEMPVLDMLPAETAAKLKVDEWKGIIRFSGAMTKDDLNALKGCSDSQEWKRAVNTAYAHSLETADSRSPAEREEPFRIPVLAYKQAEFTWEPFTSSHFKGMVPLAQMDAMLTTDEFPDAIQQVQRAKIGLDSDDRLQVKYISEIHEELRLLASDQGWTVSELVYWLDQTLPRYYTITQEQSAAFLNQLVRKLITQRNLSLDDLVHHKYRLRTSIAKKIDDLVKNYQSECYQPFLDLDTSPLEVTPKLCFSFDPHAYPARPYKGRSEFLKHYYDSVGDFDNDEEEDCAIVIDGLSDVQFWVRNPVRSSKAFSLQTSTDRFYPDFVCQLYDGRHFAIEYKGDRWNDPENVEKRQLGELWEKRSDGTCLFIMVKDRNFEAIRNKITA